MMRVVSGVIDLNSQSHHVEKGLKTYIGIHMYTSTLKRMQNLLYRQKQIEGGEGDEGGVVNKGDSEEEDKEGTLDK